MESKKAATMSGSVKSLTKTRDHKAQRVAVALSGGVDSGVAAALLVEQGYQCVGFHMHLWSEEVKDQRFENKNLAFGKNLVDSDRVFVNKCCSTESLEAARKTAHKLGMPFYVVDFAKTFKKRVVDYFLQEYTTGLTPNPCVMCNKFVKFGELLNYVRKLGFDYLATGHYARMVVEARGNADLKRREPMVSSDSEVFTPSLSDRQPRTLKEKEKTLSGWRSKLFKLVSPRLVEMDSSKRAPSPLFHLLMAKDKFKDQSYFLYNLTQKQLAYILFPVGEYTKEEVKRMAKKWKLPVAARPESQEICFFPETDYRPFLQRQILESIKPGEVVDVKGQVIGRHYGLPLYTVGQRHRFEIKGGKREAGSGIIPPYYVIAKEAKKNQLVVGFGKETERKEFWVEKVNWLVPDFKLKIVNCKLKIFVRIRHQGELLSSKLTHEPDQRSVQGYPVPNLSSGTRVKIKSSKLVKVILDEPERGIAPGQAAVFYIKHQAPSIKHQNFEVLGGGIIADYRKV